MAGELLGRYPLSQPQSPAVVLELLRITRDHLDFAAALELIARLPADLARLPVVLEQEALALGKCKRIPEAIAKLEQLITSQGPDPERLGILGGRYKDMWRTASRDGNARRTPVPGQAIDSYRSGMWLDLNEYYCASNLPRLLRSRASPATTTWRARRRMSRAMPASEPGGWISTTSGSTRRCSVRHSTPAMLTRPRRSSARSSKTGPFGGNSNRP